MPGLPQGEKSLPRRGKRPELPEVVDLNTIAYLLVQLMQEGRDLIDALYEHAAISNPGAFAMDGDPIKPVAITSGTAQTIFKNETQEPLILALRMQVSDLNEVGYIYVQRGHDLASSGNARWAMSGTSPQLSLVVQPGVEVWGNHAGTQTGIASPQLTGFTLPLAGKQLVHKQRG